MIRELSLLCPNGHGVQGTSLDSEGLYKLDCGCVRERTVKGNVQVAVTLPKRPNSISYEDLRIAHKHDDLFYNTDQIEINASMKSIHAKAIQHLVG